MFAANSMVHISHVIKWDIMSKPWFALTSSLRRKNSLRPNGKEVTGNSNARRLTIKRTDATT